MTSDAVSAVGFIGAPALLTNATSVLLLSTANRLARSVARARELAATAADDNKEKVLTLNSQLRMAQRRVLLTVWAMGLLYLGLSSFAAATLIAFVGEFGKEAGLALLESGLVRGTMITGGLGFISLMLGSALLVYETTLAYRMLREESIGIRNTQSFTGLPSG
jgi:hypothetical protein